MVYKIHGILLHSQIGPFVLRNFSDKGALNDSATLRDIVAELKISTGSIDKYIPSLRQ